MSQTRINPLGRMMDDAGIINSKLSWDQDNTTGLTFAYYTSDHQLNGNAVEVLAGTATLTDNATNIVELSDGGSVSVVTSGNEGKNPLFKVVTSAGAITSITDLRSTYQQ